MSIDDCISEFFTPVPDAVQEVVLCSVSIGGAKLPLIVGWLIVAAVVFAVYSGLIQARGFKHALQLVRGDYSDPDDAGEVSHFQALATAVSGTVGLGNIAGVAVAITIGGPGSTLRVIVPGLAFAVLASAAPSAGATRSRPTRRTPGSAP